MLNSSHYHTVGWVINDIEFLVQCLTKTSKRTKVSNFVFQLCGSMLIEISAHFLQVVR